MAGYAWAATVVCVPVIRAASPARRRAAQPPLIALCSWFVVVAWVDVGVIATGEFRLLDALGLAALVGVLGQAIATALAYVTPALRGRTNAERAALTERLAWGTTVRTATYNAGALALSAAAAGGAGLTGLGAGVAVFGWLLVLASLAVQTTMAVWPVRTS
jgi:hypothetical protein